MTGGAGFIGSNFVHHVVQQHRPLGDGARQADLRREPGVARGAPRGPGRAGRGRHRRRRRSSTSCSASTTRSCTSPPSPTTTTRCDDPSPFIQTNIVGTFTLLEAARKHDVRLHHVSHRRGLRRPRPRRPEAVHRGHALQPVARPYTASKAGSDHLVRAWVRSFGVRATISNCSNNYGPWQHIEKFIPRDDHQPDRRRPAQGVRRRAQRPRLDPRRRPLLGRAARSSSSGRIGETYLIGADGERNNLQVVTALLALFGRSRGRHRVRHRPRRPRPPLRHRVRQAPRRARLVAALPGLRGRPGRHHRRGTAPTRTGGARQAGHRGLLRRQGPVTAGDRAVGRDRPTIPGLLVVRLPAPRGQPRLVQGELAARQDDRARPARLRPGPAQRRVQRPPRRHPRRAHRAVGQVHQRRPRPDLRRLGRHARGRVLRHGLHASRPTRRSRSSCRAASATPTRCSRTARRTPTWSTTTGAPASPTRRSTSPTRPSRSPGRSRSPRRRSREKDLTTPMLDDVEPMAPRKTLIVGSKGQLGTRPAEADFPGADLVDLDELDVTDPAAGRGLAVERLRPGPQRRGLHRRRRRRDPRRPAYGLGGQRRRPGHAGPALAPSTASRSCTTPREYVFDGTVDPHTEDEPLSPLGVYAQTKAAGDVAVGDRTAALRPAHVVGDRRRQELRAHHAAARRATASARSVVDDQVGRLTFTDELVPGDPAPARRRGAVRHLQREQRRRADVVAPTSPRRSSSSAAAPPTTSRR